MSMRFVTYEPDEDNYSYQIEAFDEDTFLGYIAVNADDFNVSMVKVEEQFRRQGIGTALFACARTRFPQITTRKRTPDGDAFFAALNVRI